MIVKIEAENQVARMWNNDGNFVLTTISVLGYDITQDWDVNPEWARILETMKTARGWCSEKLNWTRSKIEVRHSYISGDGSYIKIYNNQVWGPMGAMHNATNMVMLCYLRFMETIGPKGMMMVPANIHYGLFQATVLP
ncbi:MAG: hypothetical protein J7J76_00015 [Candidatus Latescibacteria bacterium]|nr:hypothetical protein [Candidatus Latescibacterota bacterium]